MRLFALSVELPFRKISNKKPIIVYIRSGIYMIK